MRRIGTGRSSTFPPIVGISPRDALPAPGPRICRMRATISASRAMRARIRRERTQLPVPPRGARHRRASDPRRRAGCGDGLGPRPRSHHRRSRDHGDRRRLIRRIPHNPTRRIDTARALIARADSFCACHSAAGTELWPSGIGAQDEDNPSLTFLRGRTVPIWLDDGGSEAEPAGAARDEAS